MERREVEPGDYQSIILFFIVSFFSTPVWQKELRINACHSSLSDSHGSFLGLVSNRDGPIFTNIFLLSQDSFFSRRRSVQHSNMPSAAVPADLELPLSPSGGNDYELMISCGTLFLRSDSFGEGDSSRQKRRRE